MAGPVTRTACVGIDNIMNAFETVGDKSPYFSVWLNSNDKFFQSKDDNFDDSLNYLQSSLQALNNGDNCLYHLRIHPEFVKCYLKQSPYLCVIPFRLNSYDDKPALNGPGNGGMNYEMYEILKSVKDLPSTLKSNFDEINSRLTELETAENVEPDMLGKISGLMENPHISQAVGGLINVLVTKLSSFIPAMTAGAAPQTISGMNDNTASIAQKSDKGPIIAQNSDTAVDDEAFNLKLDAALERLEQHCNLADDLTLLADLADKNNAVFKLMLLQLRAQ